MSTSYDDVAPAASEPLDIYPGSSSRDLRDDARPRLSPSPFVFPSCSSRESPIHVRRRAPFRAEELFPERWHVVGPGAIDLDERS